MQRCVAKANGELAYQLLYEQEQIVTYQTYDVFMGYVYMSMRSVRSMELQALQTEHPDLRIQSLVTDVEKPDQDDFVALDTIAQIDALPEDAVEEAAEHSVRGFVSTGNQKDDFLHRGGHVLLASMSFLMYGRHVRRIHRNQAGRVDFCRYFPFAEHYVMSKDHVQAGKVN